MCGICLICSLAPSSPTEKSPLLNLDYIKSNSFLSRRGPDSHNSVSCTLWSASQAIFAGYVLHLRGHLTPQPVNNDDGDLLLWNGEIFGGIEIADGENDTQVLFEQLARCGSEEEILATVQRIQGPWALIFWQAKQKRLWFGLDVFGRRSLLWHLPREEDGTFALSSVPINPMDYEEIPSLGMFCLQSSDPNTSSTYSEPQCANPTPSKKECDATVLTLHLFPWQGAVWPGTDTKVASDSSNSVAEKLGLDKNPYFSVNLHTDLELSSWMPVLNSEIPLSESLPSYPDGMAENANLLEVLRTIEKMGRFDSLVRQLTEVLQNAVRKRVHNLPRCFDQLPIRCDNHDGHAVDGCVSDGFSHISIDSRLCQGFQKSSTHPLPCVVSKDTNGSNAESVEKKCSGELTQSLRNQSAGAHPAHVAILFSGGVDSTVLAALADRCVPEEESIDLINVAFEQKVPTAEHHKKNKRCEVSPHDDAANGSTHYNVPDRITGYSALAELNPHRQWNFVEVNVTQEMLQKQRSQYVRHLVYPLKTVLDDSIGCAVWFAARGQGVLGNGSDKGACYRSTARVILCGMGADEQLAGYSRHRVRFKEESWLGLTVEINMEIHRISARNLGRDDRIITDHSKESRFPFLDEDVVSFLAALPIHHKADLRLPRGAGEKLLLRLVALRLGLPTTAALPKRAIQFGSRIAKLEQSKEKGSQACQRLLQE